MDPCPKHIGKSQSSNAGEAGFAVINRDQSKESTRSSRRLFRHSKSKKAMTLRQLSSTVLLSDPKKKNFGNALMPTDIDQQKSGHYAQYNLSAISEQSEDYISKIIFSTTHGQDGILFDSVMPCKCGEKFRQRRQQEEQEKEDHKKGRAIVLQGEPLSEGAIAISIVNEFGSEISKDIKETGRREDTFEGNRHFRKFKNKKEDGKRRKFRLLSKVNNLELLQPERRKSV